MAADVDVAQPIESSVGFDSPNNHHRSICIPYLPEQASSTLPAVASAAPAPAPAAAAHAIGSIPRGAYASSRDVCSATLAALGNVGPLVKDARVQVVINQEYVDAIVVGCSEHSSRPDPALGVSAAVLPDHDQWDLYVFVENTAWSERYTAGFTSLTTFKRAHIYGGGEALEHALPKSCFEMAAEVPADGTDEDRTKAAARNALQSAWDDHTDPGYLLILLAFGEANLAEFASILNDIGVFASAACVSGAADAALVAADAARVRKGAGKPASPPPPIDPAQGGNDVGKAVVGPIKTVAGAARKAKDKYNGSYDKVGDIVRGTIACKTFLGVRAVVVSVFKQASIEVIRFKDRLSTAFDAANKSGGYRDILLNVRMKSTGMLTEIQITLNGILDIKDSGAHNAYDVSRIVAASMKSEGAFTRSVLKKVSLGWCRTLMSEARIFQISGPFQRRCPARRASCECSRAMLPEPCRASSWACC